MLDVIRQTHDLLGIILGKGDGVFGAVLTHIARFQSQLSVFLELWTGAFVLDGSCLGELVRVGTASCSRGAGCSISAR